MKSVTFVEIDVDHCQLVYGESPCTAALGVTGDRKCYNSRQTCQDPQNYNPEPRTIRFAVASDLLNDTGIQAIPSVVSVDHTPAVIRLGEDIGERAAVRITFADHPDSDIGQDPYIAERPNPPGTFWGRFRERHRFILGRPLRWIEGRVGQSIGDMDTRHYIIEAIDGPDVSGRVTIVAKDVLKLADGTRAQAPKLSQGVLSADISDTDTSITLSPAGIGNLEYDGVELVAISDEILRVTARSADVLTVTRGQEFTEASEHEEDDSVQAVRVYTGLRASAIVHDLLVNDANVDPALINLSQWTSDDDAFINRLYSARIAEPTPVRQLISELMEQAGFSLYVDELANAIKFVPLRALAGASDTFSDDLMAADSLSYRDQPNKRVSQVWVYFGQRNPLESLEEPKNFSVARLDVDLAAESPDQYGQSAIRKIYSRWITRAAPDNAKAAAELIIERFRNPPQRFAFALQRAPGFSPPDASQSILLRSRVLQDDAGEQVPVPVTITSRADSWRGYALEGEEFRIQPLDPDAPDIITLAELGEEETQNINLRTVYNQNRALPPTDDTNINFIVPSAEIIGGVVFGPTISTGDWPTGADVSLQVDGQVLGRGGTGGSGTDASVGEDGEAGSTAIFASRPLTLINNGTIAGGGGGGGGGGSGIGFEGFPDPVVISADGGGGGGGAGKNVGAGGFGGPSGAVPPEDGDDGTNTDGGEGGSGGLLDALQGGDGGDGGDLGQPGLAGDTGIGTTSAVGGAGGAAGAAIDGDSNVTLTNNGSIIGSQIN